MDYCSHLPVLNIAAVCGNAFEARDTLLHQQIDLIFLDINMPVLDGIAFLGTLKKAPQIIFTTAYKKYAATAFDLAACDYLVKPFSLERFIQAVDKAMAGLSLSEPAGLTDNGYMLIKSENKIYNMKKADVLYAEAKGNYTSIYFDNTVLKPKMPLSGLEKLLQGGNFTRIHRSFIINRLRIRHIEGNRVVIGQSEIPIGSSFKEQLMTVLNIKE